MGLPNNKTKKDVENSSHKKSGQSGIKNESEVISQDQNFRSHTLREMINSFDKDKLNLKAFNYKISDSYVHTTYQELQDNIRALGNAFIQMGVKKGDKIGLLSENRIEWPITYLAVTSIGAIIVPFDIFLGEDELLTVFNACHISLIITSRHYIEKISAISFQVKKLKHIICFDEHVIIYNEINKFINNNEEVNHENYNVIIKKIEDNEITKKYPFKKFKYIPYKSFLKLGEELLNRGINNYLKANVNPEDPAVMIYMHNSIFALLSHDGLMANAYAMIQKISNSGKYVNAGDKWLAGLPFHHAYPAMMGFIIPLITYGTSTILSRYKIKDVILTMKESGTNYMATVPLLIKQLYNEAQANRFDIDSLMFLITGGGCIHTDIIKGMNDLGIIVLQGYGLTEYSPIVSTNDSSNNRVGSIGQPLPNVEVKLDIIDDKGNGEILVKGPSLMLGYYNMPEKTKEIIDGDGWLHTGDIGRLDKDGYIYITGRKKNVIVNMGGKNVYPEDVEYKFLQSHYITEIKIVPKIDDEAGEYPYAIIYPNFEALTILEKKLGVDFSEKDIRNTIVDEIKKISRKIAPYNVPRDFEISYERLREDSIKDTIFMFEHRYAAGSYEKNKVKLQSSKAYVKSKNNQVQIEKQKEKREINLLIERIEKYLFKKIVQILDIPASEIDINENFFQILDSIQIINISKVIEGEIKIELYPTMLFEYKNVRELSIYFSNIFYKQFIKYFGEQFSIHEEGREDKTPTNVNNEMKVIEEIKLKNLSDSDPIAIIGISGIFPKSNNLEEFWKHLELGESLISEIPDNRFDWKGYYGDPNNEKNKTNSKWGGFVDDIDKFDALFFNISPKEAISMDPQQRILLQTVWKAIEDAGYNSDDLSGKKYGLFVGICLWDYYELLEQANQDVDTYTAIGNAHSVLANRISYILNINGPSETVDTACSSSLVALHRAVKAIETADCDAAIVGGVNALLTPRLFLAFSKGGMLSPDGRCKTFDSKANGYVRGEGAGAILLKPLSKALLSNDHIYAIIKSTAVNHGGKAGSLTAPNPDAQAELLVMAYKNANVDPSTVTYIEVHGTGTKLGDPVEINGLKKGFAELYKIYNKKQPLNNYCGIGSVKTNIGHLEAAAGIAGIIKVLLSIKYKRLPASINFEEINPYIQLDNSPFYIVKDNIPWECLHDNGNVIPRRAGISSFGFGGSNAHIVLEEYEKKDVQSIYENNNSYLIILSARNEDRLKEYAENMINFLDRNKISEKSSINLVDIAYTLKVGRKPMQERLALVVSGEEELVKKLIQYTAGKRDIENVYTGSIKNNGVISDVITEGEEGKKFIKNILERRNIIRLAKLWIFGVDIEWRYLYHDSFPNRISLPTYPFLKERFWISNDINNTINDKNNYKKLYDTFYFHTYWDHVEFNTSYNSDKITLLIFYIEEDVPTLFNKQLEDKNIGPVIYVKHASLFTKHNNTWYEINTILLENYYKLFSDLNNNNLMPDKVLYLWTVNDINLNLGSYSLNVLKDGENIEEEFFYTQLSLGIYPLYNLITALSDQNIKTVNRIVFAYKDFDDAPNPFFEALASFSQSLRSVIPNILFSTVQILTTELDSNAIINNLINELNMNVSGLNEIRYEGKNRYIKKVKQLEEIGKNETLLKNNGVYLITGGAGALGLFFAEYMVTQYNAKVILIGRSRLEDLKKDKVERLQQLGSNILYLQSDVSNYSSMTGVIDTINNVYGNLNGVIHAAGIINDKKITKKDLAEFESYLKPKIHGTIILDMATKEFQLDFFLLFSSISSILGDFGQIDYAMSNRFMDSYANMRNYLISIKKRTGKAIVINWPLWKEGGMHLNKDAELLFIESSGMSYLSNIDGINSFENVMRCSNDQIIIIPGEKDRIFRFLMIDYDANNRKDNHSELNNDCTDLSQNYNLTDGDELSIIQKVELDIKYIASELLKIEPHKLDSMENFANFGFDSITLKEFANKICSFYDIDITPTVFFNHSNIKSLCEMLITDFEDKIKTIHTDKFKNHIGSNNKNDFFNRKEIISTAVNYKLETKTIKAINNKIDKQANEIAIIGISGIFPGSKDLQEFWKNLESAKDCIVEIPEERWDWRNYFGDPTTELNKTNSKWGGFIENVDTFDAPFFNISVVEAELMDPQHRLFLQTVWKTIEDSGYASSDLSGKNIGVFVGVQFNDYNELLIDHGILQAHLATGNAHSILANRISYLFNFRGPSEAIDTACSSSIVAMNRGIQSIRLGEAEAAIVGAVSLMLSPTTLLTESQLGFLSPDGRCKTLDKKANGYVRGEGVGALFLKPLSKALEDHNTIYAVIRGIAVNHGGKANSLTAPNPDAQAELLVKAYNEAGIDIETVSYLELHGTGTELGDPVEIEGIKKAFNTIAQTQNKKSIRNYYCGIGSVKSNIGHLEPASGIAGLFKVILSMHNKKLPGTVNFNEINPYIKLENTPFYVVDKTRVWERIKDENGNPIPYRAGISSFGFGGANAHIVLEEYITSDQIPTQKCISYIIPLSAKNKERLHEYALLLLEFIKCSITNKSEYEKNILLTNLAYTLQVGREAMDERVVFIVSRLDEMVEKLNKLVAHENQIENVFFGNSKLNNHIYSYDKEDNNKKLDNVYENKKFNAIAQQWAHGIAINWNLLYKSFTPDRISLPTYPFAKNRYWIHDDALDVYMLNEEHPTNIYLKKTWERCEKKEKSNKIAENLLDGVEFCTIFVFDCDEKIYNEMMKIFSTKGNCKVLLVKPGNEYKRIDDTQFEISPHNPEDYIKILECIGKHDLFPIAALYLWSNSDIDVAPRSYLKKGLYSVFYFIQTLSNLSVKGNIYLLYIYNHLQNYTYSLNKAMCGFAKTAFLENPRIIIKNIEIEESFKKDSLDKSEKYLTSIIHELLQINTTDLEIKYKDGERYVGRLHPTDVSHERENIIIFKDKGVYLITGGMGGLGYIFAEYLTEKFNARLILIGRSPISPEIQTKIDKLNMLGAEAIYIQADISKEDEMISAATRAKSHFQKINGIIHCAGVIRDAFIIEKSVNDIEDVLAPKVYGSINLDSVLVDESLDFFILFSSISAEIGNPGQSDYAYANSFLDSFADIRNNLVKEGKRSGKTFSINWPLWKQIGMRVSEEEVDLLTEQTGLCPMPKDTGISMWEESVQIKDNHFIFLYGYKNKLLQYLNGLNVNVNKLYDSEDINTDSSILYNKTEKLLKEIFRDILKLSLAEIESDVTFEEYGIDSILVKKFNVIAERYFGLLPKTLLYEYNTISDLIKYITTHYTNTLIQLFNLKQRDNFISKQEPKENKILKKKYNDKSDAYRNTYREEEIAIIGLSGRYPLAKNLDEFWKNLKGGRDCIIEIPFDRWDYRKFYDPNPEDNNYSKMYCKWGGFLDDVDKFDPLFFSITPKDAELIDPQERLFLEIVWELFEDAGYTRSELSDSCVDSLKVGVFVGVTTYSYKLLGIEQWNDGNIVIPDSSPWSIANRVSYFYNFQGPSMPVDTACSSSLTAIHLACESIKKGESNYALVGGVNIYLHPSKYISMSQIRMLSPTGRCHTFGINSDGMVPGEGVGAVLLKPLHKAIEDSDHIYAVIKGTSINHGGRTSGYTVPNPNAQANLIWDALHRAKIDPRTISYFEAHGTGTMLGDPIEIAGLAKAYRKYTDDKQYCSIGSVKSNIGHLESAAGIAGLTKILLQMKYKHLVPSIHADELNPNIDFGNSPFYLQKKFQTWNQPMIYKDGKEIYYPRRAGISSFGAGGSYAHLIVEEYTNNIKHINNQEKHFQIIPLSAKTFDDLQKYAISIKSYLENIIFNKDIDNNNKLFFTIVKTDLLMIISDITYISIDDIDIEVTLNELGFDQVILIKIIQMINSRYNLNFDINVFQECQCILSLIQLLIDKYRENLIHYHKINLSKEINSEEQNEIGIDDIAFTLQVGREAMDYRLAIIAYDVNDLIQKIENFINKRDINENIIIGDPQINRKRHLLFKQDSDVHNLIISWIKKGRLSNLAELWTNGLDFDWKLMHTQNKPNRISLPTYPFKRESYWFNEMIINRKSFINDNAIITSSLHPLINCNESTLYEQRYITHLFGDEYFLRDHVVNNRKVFPGAAYIELARAAGEHAGKKNIRKLHDIVWVRPINISEKSIELSIYLYPNNDDVEFKICTTDFKGKQIINSTGYLVYKEEDNYYERKSLDINQIKERCNKGIERDDCYALFEKSGLKYGKTFQTIKYLYSNENEVFACLNLAEECKNDFVKYQIHPTILDGAFQAVIGMVSQDNTATDSPYVASSISEIIIMEKLPEVCYAYLLLSEEKNGLKKYNIWLINETGQVLIVIKDFQVRKLNISHRFPQQVNEADIIALLNKFQEKELDQDIVEETIKQYIKLDNYKSH